ncbi:MAG TPA: methionyl-tRNA formyltransferase [Epulopiscium sp.]|nr:methionyl-tRNA formyltransferase [Candidatus Epulonipiscium sp.]
MNIVFMGTPDFAVPTLEMLMNENYTIQAVVTQPDRPKGRGNKLAAPPVKELALKFNIPVLQPERIRADKDFIKHMQQLAPDLIVVVAFGQILPKSILDIPRFGCINIHGSLLPRYRGSSPIQRAVLNDDETTGVTIMYMDVGMDTGDIITKTSMHILPEETAGSLHDRMMYVGAEALREALPGIMNQSFTPEKQNEEEATYAPMLDKQMGLIDWEQNSRVIDCLVRGLTPWPTAYTYYDSKLLKIWKVKPVEYSDAKNKPGEIIDIIPEEGIVVKTLDGAVLVEEIQVQGKKRMKTSDYVRGHEITIGDFLGIK